MSKRTAKVARVIVWQNGMAMVFDADGQQVPELQGPWEEMMGAIRARFAGAVEFRHWPPDQDEGLGYHGPRDTDRVGRDRREWELD